jgi:Conserved region of Rad21 / Rec8 like protein
LFNQFTNILNFLFRIKYLLGNGESSDSSVFSQFSLGATNAALDLGDDEAEDERQLAGDEIVASTSKWHRNTEKVFNMLKRNMTIPTTGGESNDDEQHHNTDKPFHLMFNSMSKGASRRTAAGVFFELLQLKTWDYIDLEQDESYGNIKVSPGVKFVEDPPAK